MEFINFRPTYFLLLGYILVVSCSSKTSSIITENTCAPPCWHNITPGKSLKQDVLSMLPTITEVDPRSVKHNESILFNYDYIQWNFKSRTGDQIGKVFFEDGIVTAITLDPHRNSLQVGESIQRLGEPERILAIYDARESSSWLSIFLMSPVHGYVITLKKDNYDPRKRAEITPTDSVVEVLYLDPKSYDEVINHNRIATPLGLYNSSNIHNWTGFGPITYTKMPDVFKIK